jgi:RimK family alpha-L-glutamate ligase
MHILEFNFSPNDARLHDGLIATFSESGHAYTACRAANISFLLKEGTVTVYNENKAIPFTFDKAFVRGRGLYAHMASLIVRLLKFHKTEIYGSQSAGEFTHNDGKITQMLDLTLAKLPIPQTIIFSKNNFSHLRQIIEDAHFSFPMVLKRTGSKGSCVWKVDSFADTEEHLMDVEVTELFILQEFIPNMFDIRALYFRGQLLGAMARKSADGFYNNASKGADVEQIVLTDEEDYLAREACKVLDQDFAGVDIVRSDRGPLFFEVNNRPGYEGFERATGINVGVRLGEIILAEKE